MDPGRRPVPARVLTDGVGTVVGVNEVAVPEHVLGAFGVGDAAWIGLVARDLYESAMPQRAW